MTRDELITAITDLDMESDKLDEMRDAFEDNAAVYMALDVALVHMATARKCLNDLLEVTA